MRNKALKIAAVEMEEGEGACVKRLFPVSRQSPFDPFVLFDEFKMKPPGGVPDHPHRGFESLTYVLDGRVTHKDSMGNDSMVGTGGVQRLTSGRGIVHSEMPGDANESRGFQIWINLPQVSKKIEPSYQSVDSSEVPEEIWSGGKIRTICGPGSPIRTVTPVLFQDVELEGDRVFSAKIPDQYAGLVYVIRGGIMISEETLKTGEALLLKSDSQIIVKAKENSRFVLLAGTPHGEPMRLNGSFVD